MIDEWYPVGLFSQLDHRWSQDRFDGRADRSGA